MAAPLTFAIPKGRILDEALPVMARAGVVPEDSSKIITDDNKKILSDLMKRYQ